MPLIQAPTPPPPLGSPPQQQQQQHQQHFQLQQQQQQQHAKASSTSKQLAKSMPVTPIQPQSPTDSTTAVQHHFMAMPRSPSYELYDAATSRPPHPPLFRHAHSQSDAAAFHLQQQHYEDYDDDDDGEEDEDVDEGELDDDVEDTSSLAMITPPPPYDTPLGAASTSSAAPPPLPPPRKFRFGNRELFSMSPGTPKSNAITPTKLSAAAAAMFATPQMAQLNRKWAHLQRKRRRRNSSNGDSKELDKLVLQSVDWDENEMY